MDISDILFDLIDKFIEDSFVNIRPTITQISISDVMIAIFWSIVLSIIIGMTYRGTYKGLSYSQSFAQTLILLGIIATAVMMVIGSDLGKAFTLIGALSIIRFRNAIKETRDVAFVFFGLIIGLACGSRFYFLAIVFTITGCLLLYFMLVTDFLAMDVSQDILEFDLPIDLDYAELLDPILKKYLKAYSLLTIESIEENQSRLNLSIMFRKKIRLIKSLDSVKIKQEFINELRESKDISNIKLLEGSHFTQI